MQLIKILVVRNMHHTNLSRTEFVAVFQTNSDLQGRCRASLHRRWTVSIKKPPLWQWTVGPYMCIIIVVFYGWSLQTTLWNNVQHETDDWKKIYCVVENEQKKKKTLERAFENQKKKKKRYTSHQKLYNLKC